MSWLFPPAPVELPNPDALIGQTAQIDLLEMLWENSPDDRVQVMIRHPRMPESRVVTYGCTFEVKVGDRVVCPPAPLWPSPFDGIVVALGKGAYEGPVKYLIGKAGA